MKPPKLELYYFPSCPYCQIVMRAVDQLQLEVEYKDIHKNPHFGATLFQDTGRKTVPCLYIDGKPMHESRDIVNWLKQNEKHLVKKTESN